MAKATKKAEEVEVLGTDAESFRKAFTDHIHHTLARNKMTVTDHEKFLAVAYAVRDRLVDRWIKTQNTYYDKDVKRVYYLSLEFLIGRTLGNSVLNLDVENAVTEALDEIGMTLEELRERIPFDDIFPILNYVDLGEGDFVPGTETPVYGPYKWTPFICYDAIFGDLVREAINEGSRLMVNITNDGWFGRSTAPYQHLNLVRYRAIENGMPTARLANSGITAFIDQYGHFDKNTEIFTDRVVIRKMQLKSRDTVYQHIGDSVETALLWFFLIYLISAFALWKCGKFRQPFLQE